MSTEPLLVTKRDDGVAIISTNDDPLNRMSVAYIDLLEEVVEDIAADDAVRAFVLTAEGTTNFSVGMNLKELGGAMNERGPELKDRAIALAAELAAQPRLAVTAMLDALHDSEDKTLDELLAAERAGVHATRGTPDAREGILAFLEKRRPVFNQPS
jgi:enoyl-CoA hydratase/carnithine racemase